MESIPAGTRFVWMLLAAGLVQADDDDYYTDDDDDDNSAGYSSNNRNNNKNKNNDDGSSQHHHYSSRKGQLELTSGCQYGADIVQVYSVYLMCDSPGDYYYGSGSYRNSARCKYGDKAKMHVYFTIHEVLEDGVALSIESGVLDVLTMVQEPKDLCTYKGLTALLNEHDDQQQFNDDAITDNNSDESNDDDYCPLPNSYHLQTYFTLPLVWEDQQLQYTPDIRLLFYSLSNNELVGCASTGTVATVERATSHSKSGEWALGLALLVVGAAFGTLLCLTYRRKKRLQAAAAAAAATTTTTTTTTILERPYYHYVRNSMMAGTNHNNGFPGGTIIINNNGVGSCTSNKMMIDPLEDQYVEFRTKR